MKLQQSVLGGAPWTNTSLEPFPGVRIGNVSYNRIT